MKFLTLAVMEHLLWDRLYVCLYVCVSESERKNKLYCMRAAEQIRKINSGWGDIIKTDEHR